MSRLRIKLGWAANVRSKLSTFISQRRTRATQEPITEPASGQEPNEERRFEQRVNIDGTAHLMPLSHNGLTEIKLDAFIEDVSTGGARLVVEQVDNVIPDASKAVSVHILEGPLQGITVEAMPVYQVVDNDVVQLGVKWIESSDELSERIANLAV